MTDFLNDWGLTVVTFVPLVGALVLMAIGGASLRNKQTGKVQQRAVTPFAAAGVLASVFVILVLLL